MKRYTALAGLLPLLLSACTPEPNDTVTVDGGMISGTTEGDVRVFRGVPYAAPPVGDLRWRPPQPVQPWHGVRDGARFGSSCVYVPYPPDSMWSGREWDDPAGQSEDCLYLNVWTAARSPDERRPVMVWIHGGSLEHESGAVPAYGGANLARKGVVAVTINYRLGPFGYLAHPELSAESEHGSSGNYGVLDQIAALEWVQRNIAAFGGDPDRVTIFGESAGSWSVNLLVATPLAQGLFHRAIGQSGATFGPMVWLGEDRHGRPAAESSGMAFARIIGGGDEPASIETMRALPATEVQAKYQEMPGWRTAANIDGWVFPEEVQTIYEQGRQNLVPVIVGCNADEGSLLVGADAPTTVAAFQRYANRRYGDLADEFLAAYSTGSDAEVLGRYTDSIGDDWFTWQMRLWAKLTAAVGGKAYLYHFTRVPPIPESGRYGAYHGAEIVYVMGNFHLASFTRQAEDVTLAETMSRYWVNFADTGDPNGEGLPEWPTYDADAGLFIELGDSIRTGAHLRRAECDFFERYNAAERAKPAEGPG